MFRWTRVSVALALGLIFSALPALVSSDADARIRKLDDVSLENLIEESKAVVETLESIGHPIGAADLQRLQDAWLLTGDEAKGIIQDVIDQYCWLEIRIDDEAWLKAELASASPSDRKLVQGRWTPFLVKIYNRSDVKSEIRVRTPQELPPAELAAVEQGNFEPNEAPHSWYRWFGIKFYERVREQKEFRGVTVRYRIMGMLSRDSGLRSADLEFYFGGGAVSQGHFVKKRILFEAVTQDSAPLRADRSLGVTR